MALNKTKLGKNILGLHSKFPHTNSLANSLRTEFSPVNLFLFCFEHCEYTSETNHESTASSIFLVLLKVQVWNFQRNIYSTTSVISPLFKKVLKFCRFYWTMVFLQNIKQFFFLFFNSSSCVLFPKNYFQNSKQRQTWRRVRTLFL